MQQIAADFSEFFAETPSPSALQPSYHGGEKDPASRFFDDDWDFEEEENFLQ